MAKLPRGELHLVDGAGHLCWFDDPVEVSGRVRRFLSASGTDQPRDSGVEAPVVLLRSFHVVATTRSRSCSPDPSRPSGQAWARRTVTAGQLVRARLPGSAVCVRLSEDQGDVGHGYAKPRILRGSSGRASAPRHDAVASSQGGVASRL
jgi:hypothetical protein